MKVEKLEAQVTFVKEWVWKMESFSGDVHYYITAQSCPHCSDYLLVCTCKSFQMRSDSLAVPCKHVVTLLTNPRLKGVSEFTKLAGKSKKRSKKHEGSRS